MQQKFKVKNIKDIKQQHLKQTTQKKKKVKEGPFKKQIQAVVDVKLKVEQQITEFVDFMKSILLQSGIIYLGFFLVRMMMEKY